MLTDLQKKIFDLTFGTHEGGFTSKDPTPITGGQIIYVWAYCGINAYYNSMNKTDKSYWSGWELVKKNLVIKFGENGVPPVSSNSTDKAVNVFKPFNDEVLKDSVNQRYLDIYWVKNYISDFNNDCIKAQLFDCAISGGFQKVLNKAFNNGSFITPTNAAKIANADDNAIQKVIQARKAYNDGCYHDPKYINPSGKMLRQRINDNIEKIISVMGCPKFYGTSFNDLEQKGNIVNNLFNDIQSFSGNNIWIKNTGQHVCVL